MRRYNSTILIFLIFIIDCVTGNLPDIIGYDASINVNWWYTFVVPFMIGKTLYLALPYIMVIGMIALQHLNKILIKPIKFIWEFPDLLIALVCLSSILKSYWDWSKNSNTMSEWMDWTTYSIVFISLLILKIKWTKLQRLIGRIRRL